MRLFVCSDIHMDVTRLDRLLAQAGSPIDAVLIAGDLTNWGTAPEGEKVLARFPKVPIAAIPGNLDTPAIIATLADHGILAHGQLVRIGEWSVVGFGGGSPQNAGEILFSDEQIIAGLEPLLKNCDPLKTICLTHQPPFDTALDLFGYVEHRGSHAVRDLLDRYQPAFHFCGHIHESYSEQQLGRTLCVNVAAVKEGRAGVVDTTAGIFTRIVLS